MRSKTNMDNKISTYTDNTMKNNSLFKYLVLINLIDTNLFNRLDYEKKEIVKVDFFHSVLNVNSKPK